MRLNEERIEAISWSIVDRLADDEAVDLTMDEEDLVHLVATVLAKDLAREDEIQREAVEWVRTNKKHLQEGTDEWEIELDRRRDQIAIQRGYVLP